MTQAIEESSEENDITTEAFEQRSEENEIPTEAIEETVRIKSSYL